MVRANSSAFNLEKASKIMCHMLQSANRTIALIEELRPWFRNEDQTEEELEVILDLISDENKAVIQETEVIRKKFLR